METIYSHANDLMFAFLLIALFSIAAKLADIASALARKRKVKITEKETGYVFFVEINTVRILIHPSIDDLRVKIEIPGANIRSKVFTHADCGGEKKARRDAMFFFDKIKVQLEAGEDIEI